MVWDPTVPATNAPLASAPIRDNFAALDALMTGGGSVTFPLLAPDGSAAAPSYAFASAPDNGLSRLGSGSLSWVVGGYEYTTLGIVSGRHGVMLRSDGTFAWGSGNTRDSVDLALLRDGPGILAQKNGANLQKLRVYGDATNYTEITGVAGLMTTVVNGSGVSAIRALTQAAYDALTPKVATTLYVITP